MNINSNSQLSICIYLVAHLPALRL